MTTRRLRAFKRWMVANSIDFSDALRFADDPAAGGISVHSLCDLAVGDLVATIPKPACLTIRTLAAREMIEGAELDGVLGLCVALMYERSLGSDSMWDGYLQLLPERECVPLVWSVEEVDSLLRGTELHKVFNTYGTMGNAALLHRYGFTEPDNTFDIVNIDLNLVHKWCSSSFSSRYSRARQSLWRQLNYSGCTSENSEYFEISFDGEPQTELVVLLYIIFLREDAYEKLSCMVDSFSEADESTNLVKLINVTIRNCDTASDKIEELLLTRDVCTALVTLADMRERLYGSSTLKDDENKLRRCCPVKERKLYHSFVLRVSERTILSRLRKYASRGYNTKKRKV